MLEFEPKMNLGVYVQVPFCQTKCTYCNFHTGVVSSARFAPYADAVCREIREHRSLYAAAGLHSAPLAAAATVDTIYIGGGTPSLLDAELLRRMLDAIRVSFTCRLAEVTLEADPETVAPPKALAWRTAGIDRVSFGVQSFVDKELAASGRMHRREDIYRAVPILREAGIQNISFDLIAGLPHQTAESWRQSLSELVQLEPQHVSIYLLEIDEGSRLGREALRGGKRYRAANVPSEDVMADSYERARAELREAGYEHYEISNWAKPGFASRHNLKYWRRGPYLGFGAGAHSFSGSERWANAHDSAQYVAALEAGRLPVNQREEVSAEQALNEELFLGLRQLAGVDLSHIERQYGVSLSSRIAPLAKRGLLQQEGSLIRLAPDRLSVSNEAFVELLH